MGFQVHALEQVDNGFNKIDPATKHTIRTLAVETKERIDNGVGKIKTAKTDVYINEAINILTDINQFKNQ